MSDSDSDESEIFSSSSEEEDTVEKMKIARRKYRPKRFQSKGVVSKEWVVCR